jgi:hypothetical protein
VNRKEYELTFGFCKKVKCCMNCKFFDIYAHSQCEKMRNLGNLIPVVNADNKCNLWEASGD